MLIGLRLKTRWGSSVLLALVSWGLLATEIHGILGHTHGEPSSPRSAIENRVTPSDFQLVSLKSDDDDPFCSICFYSQILRHTLIPVTACLVDSCFVTREVTVHRICLVQSEEHQAENRGPPSA